MRTSEDRLSDAPRYGRAFALWRTAAGDTWSAYTHHPFVEGLRSGSLPQAAFLHYLAQDYLFLIHFARAWALAVVKADTLEDMAAAAATVHGLLHEETRLHVATCAAAGIDRAALAATEEAAENLAYTRYVLETGYSGDILDLLAVLAPCVLGYGEIGARLAATAAPETSYRPWIDAYASADYQQICREAGALIDGVAARRLGPDLAASPRWPQLAGRFRTATRLEVGFWQMGLQPA